MYLKLITVVAIFFVTGINCQVNPCLNTQCGPRKTCRLQTVYCIRAPCYPIPVCRRRTGNVAKCGPGRGGPVLGMDGQELFCGRGPLRSNCPAGTSCNIHPADRFAVCCWRGMSIMKPGVCPVQRPGMGICQAMCSTDADCPGRKKCCGSCPRKCRNPVQFVRPKPGRCPSYFNPQRCQNRRNCVRDSDCRSNLKCCGSPCGRICKRPLWQFPTWMWDSYSQD